MRPFAFLLVTLALLVPAWPGSAAAQESACHAEYDGCAARLNSMTPVAALKCVDGFQACSRECAAVDVCRGECWANGVASTAPRLTGEKLASWLNLDGSLGTPARSTRSVRR